MLMDHGAKCLMHSTAKHSSIAGSEAASVTRTKVTVRA